MAVLLLFTVSTGLDAIDTIYKGYFALNILFLLEGERHPYFDFLCLFIEIFVFFRMGREFIWTSYWFTECLFTGTVSNTVVNLAVYIFFTVSIGLDAIDTIYKSYFVLNTMFLWWVTDTQFLNSYVCS